MVIVHFGHRIKNEFCSSLTALDPILPKLINAILIVTIVLSFCTISIARLMKFEIVITLLLNFPHDFSMK